jgi:hypothetical protein
MQPTRYSFILRIWFEQEGQLDKPRPRLRGSLQRPGFDATYYFHNLNALPHLLEKFMAWKDEVQDFIGETNE